MVRGAEEFPGSGALVPKANLHKPVLVAMHPCNVAKGTLVLLSNSCVVLLRQIGTIP